MRGHGLNPIHHYLFFKGTCNYLNGTCNCQNGYEGPDCSLIVENLPQLRIFENQSQNNMHHQCTEECMGKCNHVTGQCNCIDFCNLNGICNKITGICECFDGHGGDSCES